MAFYSSQSLSLVLAKSFEALFQNLLRQETKERWMTIHTSSLLSNDFICKENGGWDSLIFCDLISQWFCETYRTGYFPYFTMNKLKFDRLRNLFKLQIINFSWVPPMLDFRETKVTKALTVWSPGNNCSGFSFILYEKKKTLFCDSSDLYISHFRICCPDLYTQLLRHRGMLEVFWALTGLGCVRVLTQVSTV